jgi:two-component system, cell cycle response regulator DivK
LFSPSSKGSLVETDLILIVDDDHAVREVIRRMLDTCYDVIEADNGSDALALARRYHPDLILLDLKLRSIDGYDLTRLLRAEPQLRNTPILLVTGHDVVSARAAALAAGCTEVLQKPFRPTELRQTVAALIEAERFLVRG